MNSCIDVIEPQPKAVKRCGVAPITTGARQWSLPTPCARALVDPVVGGLHRLVTMPGGTPPENPDRASRTGSCRAYLWRTPGVMDRPTAFRSQLTIGTFAWMLTTDVCAHTQDLARTIAANEQLDAQLVVAQRIEK